MTTLARVAFALAMMVSSARALGAQSCNLGTTPGSCTGTTSATLTVGKVVQLTLATTSTTLPAPTITDYTNGYLTVGGQTVTIRANASVVVRVAARTSTWSATSTTPGVVAWATKPSTDLQLGAVTTGPFTSLTTAGYTLSNSGATANLDLPVAYKLLLDWGADTPGQYSLDVVYTVTAP
jgi:hypothetical protein